MSASIEQFKLSNGVEIPSLGLGTYTIAPRDAEKAVESALRGGYTLVDTANAYMNEIAVGRGIRNSGVARDKIFLSTKLWVSAYENPKAVEETLERLKTDYLDLLFIHQPSGNWLAGYRQLEKAYKEGKIRSIGISDFEEEQLDELLSKAEIKPQVIQLEAHPFCTRADYRPRLEKEGLTLMSWYPLGHGDKSLVEHPLFKKLGEKYHKSSAQVILRWHTQMGFIVIPGSRSAEHIRDNADIFDFKLTAQEMAEIAKLDGTRRYYIPDPKVVAGYANYKPDFYND